MLKRHSSKYYLKIIFYVVIKIKKKTVPIIIIIRIIRIITAAAAATALTPVLISAVD